MLVSFLRFATFLMLLFIPFITWGENVLLKIDKVQFRNKMLNIESSIVMSSEQIKILKNGIPLTFQYIVRIKKVGFLRLHREVFEGKHNIELRYHGLSKQYVVKDIEGDKQKSYPTLSLALSHIANLKGVEVEIEQEPGTEYMIFVKLRLDIEALPAPLRIPAYLSNKWRLSTDWYRFYREDLE